MLRGMQHSFQPGLLWVNMLFKCGVTPIDNRADSEVQVRPMRLGISPHLHIHGLHFPRSTRFS